MIQVMPRADRGIGAFAIAVDGHWNSRMAGKVGSAASPRERPIDRARPWVLLAIMFLVALYQAGGGYCRPWALLIHVPVLLRP